VAISDSERLRRRKRPRETVSPPPFRTMCHTQNLPCLLQLSDHPNSANYSSKPRGSRSADTSFFFLFFSSQRPSSKRCAKCRHCFHNFPEEADLSGKCVKKVRIRCDARLDMRVITGIDAETEKTNMRRLFHFFLGSKRCYQAAASVLYLDP